MAAVLRVAAMEARLGVDVVLPEADAGKRCAKANVQGVGSGRGNLRVAAGGGESQLSSCGLS